MKTIMLMSFLLVINPYLSPEVRGAAQQEEVELLVGELKIFPVEELKRVMVGDPGVADVSILSATELMLMAKSPGTTTLLILDKAGERSYTINVVAEDTGRLADQIGRLLEANGIEGVIVKVERGKVFLIGEVIRPKDAEQIREIIKPFPQVVNLVKARARQPLVQIDVEVLEVTRSDLKKLGVKWEGATLLKGKVADLTFTEGKTSGGDFTLGFGTDGLLATLRLLIAEGKARTLANPSLVTLSGKEASFVVGGEVPIVTVTEEKISVIWRTYGVVLEIMPMVMETGEIQTTIRAEVSEVDWAHTVRDVPAVKSNEASTELYLKSGETIILAGLIKTDESKNADRFPFLSRIPVLGEFFKSTGVEKKEKELVITITPIVIETHQTEPGLASGNPAREVASPFRSSLKKEASSCNPADEPDDDFLRVKEAKLLYSRLLQQSICRALAYPDSARENGWEGMVVVGIRLLSDGSLEEATIAESSGITTLDRAALAAVEREAPYPPFPHQMELDKLSIEIPIVYKNSVSN